MTPFSWFRFGASLALMLVTFLWLSIPRAHAGHGPPLAPNSFRIVMYCHDLDLLNALMELPADGTFQSTMMTAIELGDCVAAMPGARFVLSDIEKTGSYTDPDDSKSYIIIKGTLPEGGEGFTSISPEAAEFLFGQET